MRNTPIPIYVLTGFLGSGKTTVLLSLLGRLQAEGKRPAVLMNEYGDADVDGQLIDESVPMESLLGGCICCTISGDVSMTILTLCEKYDPDVLVIEATGIAHPAEIIESITEASLLARAALTGIIHVMDACRLVDCCTKGNNKETRLHKSQMKAANWLILNKIDCVPFEHIPSLERWIRESNPVSPLVATVKGQGGLGFLNERLHPPERTKRLADNFPNEKGDEALAVRTYYLDEPVSLSLLKALCQAPPRGFHRMKGIVRFEGEEGFHLVHYAYRKLDLIPIQPQKTVQEVLVLIGESQSLNDLHEPTQALIRF